VTVAELKQRTNQILDWLQYGVASEGERH